MAKTKSYTHSSNIDLPQPQDRPENPLDEIGKPDYAAISQSLFQKGEFCLLQGDKSGIEYFEMASKLDPLNDALFLKQGLSLFEYSNNAEDLEGLALAGKKLKHAVRLNPSCFEAWHLWGNALYLLGVRKNEPSYFSHALKKYEKAHALSENASSDVLADFYWDCANLWNQLAQVSGEITDAHYAIQDYEKAIAIQEDLPLEFWMDFGEVCTRMGRQTNDLRFLFKAIDAFKNAASISVSSHEGWFSMGKVLHLFYQYSHDEDHFLQANECFSTAIKLSPKLSEIWQEWARLLLESGAIFRDPKKLRSGIEKAKKALRLGPKTPQLIALEAEGLALLGSALERLDLIHEGLNKIDPLIENSEEVELFLALGTCYAALGSYYKDIDYYYQAIESFQEGLSINRAHFRLWYGIASSSFASALLDQDETSFERSCHFFRKALKLQKSSLAHSHYAMCLLKFGELMGEKSYFEESIAHFEEAINLQKNASYLHPDWIFSYGTALDHLAGHLESDAHYVKALDLLNHVLMLSPDFPHIHYQLAITFTHYGELTSQPEVFHRAVHHYRIAHQKEKENDAIILDWALTLAHLGDLLENSTESDQYFREAEYKMIQAAKLGNTHAYYSLACLYSLTYDLDNSLRFLQKAQIFDSLPSMEEILEDDWLENLRETEAFHAFMHQ
ncbi:MAG: hypothetical protein KDK60_00575 [Chlamydiia bacterium]|nr:hypothetical protein [Chlamydiia bacterium]